jgi:Tfp pilus assembly protein PilF
MGIFNLESEDILSQCRKNVFATITIFIIILSIYSNTFHAAWHFDDEQNIIKREAVNLTKLTWPEIKETFFNDNGNIYRPVACLSLALNYYFGKDNVFGYHVVNTFIHFFASIFLFLFIYRTLNLPLLKAKYGPNSYFIALLSTLFWAINPVQTQAITYIVQRMASMAGMFYIMSMYFYLRGRTSEQRVLKSIHYILCAFFGIMAFGSKENAAMLPISIFLFDLFLIQGLTKEHIKKNIYILLGLIIVPLILGLTLRGSSIFQPADLASTYGRSYTLIERLLTEPRVIIFYITLLLYPMPNRLCLVHDISPSHNLIDPPATILAIFVIFLVVGIALAKAKRWPLISFCIVFYFLNHIIESSVFPLELIFEHRNYLPSMLFFVPIAILVVRGIGFFSYKKSMQLVISLFITLVLIGQGHSTFIRNAIWKTEESLWLDAVDKNPDSARAHHNLGRYYANTNQKKKAIEEYELVLQKERGTHGITHHLTHYNLALELMKMNENEKAKSHLLEAIEIFPKFANAYTNLSIIMAKEGKYDDAYDYLIKSLTYDSRSPEAHNNLGYMLIKRNQIEEAIIEFQKALQLKEDYKPALHNMGIAYKYKGDLQEAARCFRSVLRQDPKALWTKFFLAETYYLMGKTETASRMISHTLNFFSPKEVYAKLREFYKKNNLQELPDRSIIMPMLKTAYLKRSASLEKMGNDLWKGIETD